MLHGYWMQQPFGDGQSAMFEFDEGPSFDHFFSKVLFVFCVVSSFKTISSIQIRLFCTNFPFHFSDVRGAVKFSGSAVYR